MKLQALFVLAAAAAFVAADANPFALERPVSEDAFIDDVGASIMAAPAPINAQHPHLAVTAALKKPTKPGQRRHRTPKKPLTPEQRRRRQAKMRARRARLAKAGKDVAGRVARTVKTRSSGTRRPRIHGKPGGTTRRPTRKPKVSLATLLQKKINALPVGSPLRVMYERKLARIKKPKITALMSIAETPAAFGSPAGLAPFVDPPFPARVEWAPGDASKIVRDGLTQGSGIQHKYGFRTTTPLAVPAGAKYATVQVAFMAEAQKPIHVRDGTRYAKPAQPITPLCTMGYMAMTVFHGNKPIGGKKFDRGSYGSGVYEWMEFVVPVSQLSLTPAPIMLQVAQEHASPTQCIDRSYAQFRALKVTFHDALPVKPPAPFVITRGNYRDYLAGRLYAVADEAFDGGYDMWEDMYDDEGFSLEDSYDEDAAADDEY